MLRAAGRRLAPLLRRQIPAAASSSLLSPAADESGSSPDVRTRLPLLGWTRGFASESLIPRQDDFGIAGVPATVAALTNPSPKITYGEHNQERYPPGDSSKRAFAYFVLSGGRFVYAFLLRLLVFKLVLSISASKDVFALVFLEADLSTIEPGTTVTVKRRGKPVFIRRRMGDDLKLANSVEVASLCDPQEDAVRVTRSGLWCFATLSPGGCS